MSDYCGVGPVPKNRRRGTAKYCASNKQVRYYGIKKINPKLVEVKAKEPSLIKEQLKLRRLQDRGRILIRNLKHLDIAVDNPYISETKLARLGVKYSDMLDRRDRLVKQIKSQQRKVDRMEQGAGFMDYFLD